jgi:malate dehydrogenase
VRILVVGNPCNTNCLIARAHAADIPDDRWFAMTRLDENRAKYQLARRAGVQVGAVTNLAIWGNHSSTQYPDAAHARIGGRPAPEVIGDEAWLQGEFLSTVQGRGAAIIKARGASSAGSAANAIVDSVRAINGGTAPGDWSSLAVISQGEYGVPSGLVCSFPVRSDGSSWHVVADILHGPWAEQRIRASVGELEDEQRQVRELGLLAGA